MASLSPEVRVFQDLEALSHAAAALFVDSAGRAIADRGRCQVALSGGSTPERLYQLLAKSPYREQVDWPHLEAFWGDERCVPIEDLQNNYRQAHDILLGHVPVPSENIHRIRTELEPAAAAEDYARVLRLYATAPLAWPRFDVVLLGMGEDGHTASLFPGSDPDAAGPVLAATAQYQDRPSWRVSLAPPVFNSARRILFLVSGQNKSEVLASVLYGEYRPQTLPAQRIRPTDGELIWLVDQSATTRN